MSASPRLRRTGTGKRRKGLRQTALNLVVGGGRERQQGGVERAAQFDQRLLLDGSVGDQTQELGRDEQAKGLALPPRIARERIFHVGRGEPVEDVVRGNW